MVAQTLSSRALVGDELIAGVTKFTFAGLGINVLGQMRIAIVPSCTTTLASLIMPFDVTFELALSFLLLLDIVVVMTAACEVVGSASPVTLSQAPRSFGQDLGRLDSPGYLRVV